MNGRTDLAQGIPANTDSSRISSYSEYLFSAYYQQSQYEMGRTQPARQADTLPVDILVDRALFLSLFPVFCL